MGVKEDGGARVRLGEGLDLVLAAVPLVFAVPILYGLGVSLADLMGTAHPYFRDAAGVNLDGLAIRLGGPLYQDPAAGYTPNTYTPLMPLLAAGLDLVKVWSGWTLLISILSALGLMAVAGWLAYSPTGPGRARQVAAVAGASGMAAIAFWFVAFVPFNFLYSGRADHLAWALGLAGIVLVPSAVRGSTRGAVAALTLLSLSFWAKQTGALAAGVGLAWLVISAARGRCSWRRALALCFLFAAVNGALWLLLDVLTDGWSVIFTVDLPRRYGTSTAFGVSLGRLLRDTAAPALLAAILWLPVLWRRLRDGEGPMTGLGEAGRARVAAAAPLALFVLVGVPLTARFGQAHGSVDNQYVGVAWALALIAAVGFGVDQRRRPAALVAAGAVAVLFLGTQSSAVVERLAAHRIFVPAKSPRAAVAEEPGALRALAARRAVYHPVYSDVSVEDGREPYPTDNNVVALSLGGTEPGHLVDALLRRRFDVVYAFQDRGLNNGFGGDRLEDAYTWKLDEVIRRKYRLARLSPALEAARTVPIEFGFYESPGVYVRRPGPDPAPWLSACFGPFRLRATTWDIRTGGGLWCRLPRDGQTLRLVTTPAPVTEVRSQERGAPRGTVGINLAARGTFAELAPAGADPGWTLRVERPASRRRPAVTLAIGGRLRGTMSPRAWPVRLRLRPGSPSDLHLEGDAIVARIPRGERPLLLRASTTSGATFDLADLRLG